MRRPLTVRLWFRVLLLVVVLIGGYMAAYLLLRTWEAKVDVGVSVQYAHGTRFYATGDLGRIVAGLYAGESTETWNSSLYVEDTTSSQVSSDEMGLSDEYAQVYVANDDDWRATACRVFYLAERIELWVRGETVQDGESIVVGP